MDDVTRHEGLGKSQQNAKLNSQAKTHSRKRNQREDLTLKRAEACNARPADLSLEGPCAFEAKMKKRS